MLKAYIASGALTPNNFNDVLRIVFVAITKHTLALLSSLSSVITLATA